MRQLYEREDILSLSTKLSSSIREGDSFYVLKFTQYGWTADECWSKAGKIVRCIVNTLMRDKSIANVCFGFDIFQNGYPHVNMIIHYSDECSEDFKPLIAAEIEEHIWQHMPKVPNTGKQWQPVWWHRIETQGEQWTPVWFAKRKSLFNSMNYIFKRALKPAVRKRWSSSESGCVYWFNNDHDYVVFQLKSHCKHEGVVAHHIYNGVEI